MQTGKHHGLGVIEKIRPPHHLLIGEYARAYKITPGNVHTFLNHHKLPYVKIDKHVFIDGRVPPPPFTDEQNRAMERARQAVARRLCAV